MSIEIVVVAVIAVVGGSFLILFCFATGVEEVQRQRKIKEEET